MPTKSRRRLSEEEIRAIVEQYRGSGLSRRQFSEQIGIHITTLDHYRRRYSKAKQTRLIPVTVVPSLRSAGFTIVLGNGRRIESQWEFHEPALSRLVQLLERS